jgi:hypothetical protein
MKEIDISQIQGFLVGQVIAATIGALLLLVDEFAGFYYSIYYTRTQVWGYVYLGSGVLPTILILVGVGGLLFALNSAVKTMKMKGKADAKLVEENALNSIRGGVLTSGLAFISALIFIVVTVLEGTEEWWLGGGFYGAFLGGLFVVIFGKLILDRITPGIDLKDLWNKIIRL